MKAAKNQGAFAFVVNVIPGMQLVLDGIILLLCGFATYYSLVHYSYKSVDLYYFAIVFIWLVSIMLFYFSDLYKFNELLRVSSAIGRLIAAVTIAFILMFAVMFAIKISDIYSRVWFFSFYVISILALIMSRIFYSRLILHFSRNGLITRNIAVYGGGRQVEQFIQHMNATSPPFMKIVGVFSDDGKTLSAAGTGVAGDFDDLIAFVRSSDVDDVVVAMPWAEDKRVADIIDKLRELPTNVFLSADIVGYKVPFWEPPNYFEWLPLFQVVGKSLSGWDVVLKAAEDYVLSILLCIILAPLLIAVAILIKLDSPGPVIFRQKRHGFNNQVFDIYKFRTMAHSGQPAEKTVQATPGDPRVTGLGRFLRRSSIDELPQLFNVLNGTMSLVGPRPHAIDHNEEYATKIRGYLGRHKVKPGITGLAQVKGFRGLTDTVEKMEGRVRYDLEYADSWSIALDAKILILTLFTAFGGRNAF